MNHKIASSFVAAALVLGLSGFAQAQGGGQNGSASRAQVKMDRDAFLAMARWDEVSGQWVLKDGMTMPDGVPTRAEVKAMRDKFLSMNTWDNTSATWTPVKGAPRDMSKLTRADVKADTIMFLKTHRFDESTSEWVAKKR